LKCDDDFSNTEYFISLDLSASLAEIDDKEDDATQSLALVDDIMMSKQGSAGLGSDDDEVLDFPKSDNNKGYEMMDVDYDIDPDSIMPDLVVPDVDVPDLAVPDIAVQDLVVLDLVNYVASMKVTKVSVRTVSPGVSMITSAFRVKRGVL
jgi:hypothetical protein